MNSPILEVFDFPKSGVLVSAKRLFSLAAKIAPKKAIHSVKCWTNT